MLIFIKQKLLHKKWLNACLLIGIIILVAVASCLPMYQNMAKNQAFQNRMKEYISKENTHPARVSLFEGFTVKDGEKAYEKAEEKVKQYETVLKEKLSIIPQYAVTLLTLKEDRLIPLKNAGKGNGETNYRVSVLSDFEEHTKLVSGKIYKDSEDVKKNGEAEEGVISLDKTAQYTCVVSAAFLEKSRFYVGQTLEFKKTLLKDGTPLRITITGVFEEKEQIDAYWVEPPSAYTSHLFVTEAMMKDILAQLDGNVTLRYQYYGLYDYENIKAGKLPAIYKAFKRIQQIGFEEEKVQFETNFYDLLAEYMEDQKKITATLWILELPILILILVFIYMISSQILELEGNEIATLKSRGVSLKQIVWLYFCQSLFLSVVGMIIGLPLGYGICRLLGQSNAFLEFVNRPDLPVEMTGMTVFYCIGALICSVAFMTLPLVRIAREDIVAKKSRRGKSDKGIWDRYYLDVVLLVVSGYAYYSFQSQKGEIAAKVLNGEGLDPFLFLSATLFMVGFGMVLLRVLRLLVNLVYQLGRKKWSPAMYASFLQIMRTRGKQGFISLFLVVALAMGVFYSNVARTINQNEEVRAYYDTGTDMVIKQEWTKMSRTYANGAERVVSMFYTEPAVDLFPKLEEKCETATKVINRNVSLSSNKHLTDNGQMIAVQTKEFGETARMSGNVLDKHWYYYLNDLAADTQNVLVSSNMQDEYHLELGDTVSFTPYTEDGSQYEDTLGKVTGTICGFVDAWPGYTGYKTVTDEEGVKRQEQVYLVVANYAFVENASGTQPCEIWAKTDGDNEEIYNLLSSEEKIRTEYIRDAEKSLTIVKQSALVQITNGMLTLSFLVVLTLCAIGFLIYWITSIRQRELLFGIYRAMGMSMKDIIKMLINEQVFCSLVAIFSGVISGLATSKIFISLITIAYSPESHCLKYQLYSSWIDMLRIGLVVTAMLAGCIFVLAKMLGRMKIAQALKLGED